MCFNLSKCDSADYKGSCVTLVKITEYIVEHNVGTVIVNRQEPGERDSNRRTLTPTLPSLSVQLWKILIC